MSLFEKIKGYLAVPAKAVGQAVQRDAEASLEFPEQSIIGLTKASQAVQKGIEDASVYGINKGKEYGLADPFVETLGAIPSIASRMALPQTEEETGAMLATPLVNPLAKFMVEEGTIAGKGMYQGGKALVDKLSGMLPPPPSAMEPALAEGISSHMPSTTLMPAEEKGTGMLLAKKVDPYEIPHNASPNGLEPKENTTLFISPTGEKIVGRSENEHHGEAAQNWLQKKEQRILPETVDAVDAMQHKYGMARVIFDSEGVSIDTAIPLTDAQIQSIHSEMHGMKSPKIYVDVQGKELKTGVFRDLESATSFISNSLVVDQPIPKPYAAPFYSYLEQTVQDKMPARMAGKDLQGLLTNAQVKREELQYSGMDELFEKPVVTKQEVLDHLQANKIELKELTLGNKDFTPNWKAHEDDTLSIYQDGNFNLIHTKGDANEPWVLQDNTGNGVDYEAPSYIKTDAEAKQWATEQRAQMKGAEAKDTKFEAYQLPGGKNYKEMLFQLPQKDTYIKQQGTDDFAIYRYNENTPIREGLHENEVQQVLAEVDPQRYQSSHFDEPNILAHTRFNEIKDAQGKKVLRIEEIQSDWHQEGREKGYAKGKNLAERLQEVEYHKDNDGYYIGYLDNKPVSQGFKVQKDAEEAVAEYLGTEDPRTPDAPFKKNWHEMVMRRMIRYAAENGFDKVAWTTGQQQAKRYSLSKQIEHVEWGNLQDGMRRIELMPKGNAIKLVLDVDAAGKVTDGPLGHSEWVGKDLKQVIGKGIAEKIMKEGTGKLTGVGLDIGGEGMKGFYDEMLPSYVNKFTKKWGGQVVDEKFGGKGKALSTADKQAIRQTLREVANGNLSREEANDELDGLYELSEDVYDNLESTGRDRASRSNETSSYITSIVNNISKANNEKAKYTLHTLALTPEMKRAALTKGFPLFSGAAILNYLNDGKDEKKKGVQ